MAHSGEADNIPAARERDEANIRWLLAAVLHHQPDDESGEPQD
jgi:hypothetical protein